MSLPERSERLRRKTPAALPLPPASARLGDVEAANRQALLNAQVRR